MRFRLALAVVVGAGWAAVAQRPSSSSICDYYAGQRYGANNSTTQYKLMENIVAMAFGGASGLPNASPDSTGILNPGTFEGQPVNLRSWFDGSKPTTNFNGQPVGINWLDAGAQDPLVAFLNGSTPDVQIANTTNEHRLFTHFFAAFGGVFGCSGVSGFPRTNESGGFISLAYVHKFMNLNQTDLGHFIDQLTTSSRYFGFSDTDAQTLSTYMNAKYNVRCAPPVNGQLYSLCQAPGCPLAAPSPDCSDYANLGPSGVGNGTAPTQTQAPSPSSSGGPGSTSAAALPSSSGTASATSSAALSGGAIAGISIGGAAVLLIALGLVLFFVRRPSSRQPSIIPVPYPAGGGYGSPSHPSYHTNPHTSFSPSGGPHDSYMGFGGAPGYYAPKPDEVPMAGGYGIPQQHETPPPQQPQMVEIAEMASPSSPQVRHSAVPSQQSASPMGYVDPMQRWDGPRSP